MNVEHSRTVRALSVGYDRLRTAFETAEITRSGRRAVDHVRAIGTQSYVADGMQRSAQAVQASWLFQWLTTEPDPDVVVIDLRETVVVGPILQVLDSLLTVLESGWNQARAGILVETIVQRFVARPIQVLSSVVLVILITNIALLVALMDVTAHALGLRLLAASIALGGTRLRISWDDITNSRVYHHLVALLEPPDPPRDR